MTKLQGVQDRGLKPQVGWLTVNRECNMRCSWCYAKGTNYDPADNMSFNLAVELATTMKSLGVKKVTLIGGEPTLWPHLLDFVPVAHDLGLATTLVTNATRFGIDRFWNAYRATHCTHTNLSIKAFDESSYRDTTGRSNFEVTKKGISRALTLESSVAASVVYTGEEVDEIVELARFTRECGAEGLTISPSTPAYVDGKPEVGFVSHPTKFVAGIVKHYEELNALFCGNISISVKLPLCIWPRDFILLLTDRGQIYSTCQLQHRSGLLFDVNGKLISCNSLPDHGIGQWGADFSDAIGLQKHVNSGPVVSFYDRMTSYASSKCMTCSMRQKCGGGCPLFYGVFSAEDLIRGWDNPDANVKQAAITKTSERAAVVA